MAQLVEALCYEPEGRGLGSRRGHWDFSRTSSFQPHYGPGATRPLTERDRGWVGFLNDSGSVKTTPLTAVFGITVSTVRD